MVEVVRQKTSCFTEYSHKKLAFVFPGILEHKNYLFYNNYTVPCVGRAFDTYLSRLIFSESLQLSVSLAAC